MAARIIDGKIQVICEHKVLSGTQPVSTQVRLLSVHTQVNKCSRQAATIFSFLDCPVRQVKLLAQTCPNNKTVCVKLKSEEYVDNL